MNRLRVLIVDDEIPMLEQLSLFPWITHGYELVGKARSGRKALQILEAIPVDVLITDISMPGMDGLELSEHVASAFPSIQIIFLTLYRDFDYARDAIRFGVGEYLLKGAYEEEELVQALARVQRRLENSSAREEVHDASLRQLLDTGDSGDLEVPYPFRIVVVRVLMHGPLPAAVLSWTRQCCRRIGTPVWRVSEDCFYVAAPDDAVPRLIEQSQEEAVKEIRHHFRAMDIRAFTACGPVIRTQEQFVIHHKQAQVTAESGFYNEDRSLLPWQAEPWRRLHDDLKLQLSASLFRALADEDQTKAFLLNDLPAALTASYATPRASRTFLMRWLSDIELPSEGIEDARTLGEAMEAFRRIISRHFGKWRSAGRREVAQAIHFLQSNLDQPVTLSDAAEYVCLSTNYLGTLFREHLGHGFKWYQSQLRMTRATQLLSTTNLRVNEIADRVGIRNYRYFTHLFHEHTGMSPTSYRSQIDGSQTEENRRGADSD